MAVVRASTLSGPLRLVMGDESDMSTAQPTIEHYSKSIMSSASFPFMTAD
jgi:hypothetical protein